MRELGKLCADGKETGARRFPAVCPQWNPTPPWSVEFLKKEGLTGTALQKLYNADILITTVVLFYAWKNRRNAGIE